MNLSHFVTRSAAVVALASLIGCSSSSSSTGSSDTNFSKNGCTVTVTGAFTITNAPCSTFIAASNGIQGTLKDKPASGDGFTFTANLDTVATGTYTNGSSSTEIFGMDFTTGGTSYSNAVNANPSNGTVKLDSVDNSTLSSSYRVVGGSYSADLYKSGDNTTVVGHAVVTF